MSRNVSEEYKILAPEVKHVIKRKKDLTILSLRNSLGRKNWSQSVQDDLDRLNDRKFIPLEECLFSDIHGQSIISFGDVVHGTYISPFDNIFKALECPVFKKKKKLNKNDEVTVCYNRDLLLEPDDDLLDTKEKIAAWVFEKYSRICPGNWFMGKFKKCKNRNLVAEKIGRVYTF